MRTTFSKLIPTLLMICVLGVIGGALAACSKKPSDREKRRNSVPVEVAPIERGEIELRRTFSGTVEAAAKFVVAPKVDGRIVRLAVDLSDDVLRGQVVAELDNAEYVQAVSQSEADLAVARANLSQANSALEIATRELSRVRTLLKRGVASEAQYDTSRAEELARKAQLEVAEAQVTRAQASLETARIRLGYTRITADWTGGDAHRIVGERFVDEGETVSANAPLLSIVELDPVIGVIFVTEKDYTWLQPDRKVRLLTDAWPDTPFEGKIARIAPIFRQTTRQARVELIAANPDHRLKPGMFIRAAVVLDRVADAVIVPEQAITRRNERTGVFVVAADSQSVTWREVRTGIRDGDRVQVHGDDLTGRVVILGQQLLDNGSQITIPDQESRISSTPEEVAAQ
ncbi:MAG: RND transporter [Desulfatitalea sp. BRH_c12]|nr:MAG: RND transporter [Desulfatitalea sp. BRH_c12]